MQTETIESYADRYVRSRIETLEQENERLGNALTTVVIALIEAVKKTHPADGMEIIKDLTTKTMEAMGNKR